LPVRDSIVTVTSTRPVCRQETPLDRRPPAPKTRREERRTRRLAEREAERERARRKQSRPAWQDPTLLITGAALILGLALFVLLVVRPGSSGGTPSSSGNPLGLVKPIIEIPAGLADGRAVGKADAPVTIDVWADFQCPFCGEFARTVEPQIIKNEVAKGTVRLVAHDFTFIGAGQNPDESTDASVAARCADRQGKFWDYYETLFWNQGETENSGAYTQDRLLAMADLLGLDRAAFQTCLADPTLRTAVVTETAQGRAAGVASTPTSFINGKAVVGLKDYETISALIAAAAPSGAPAGSGASAAPSKGASAAP
jgi:protein-disulfide isomerase